MKKVLCAAVFALPLTAGAGAPGMEIGQELVEAFVKNVITLSSQFEQRVIDEKGDVLEFSSGTLDIHRPGRFRWAYLEPYEQILVADGTNVWSYDVDLEQVTVRPQGSALANTPALLLGGSDAAIEDFDYDGSYMAESLTWVRMRPRLAASDFKSLELAFRDGVIAKMRFLDNLEQTTLLSLYDVTVNPTIDAGAFSFVPPDGVDVVGAMATTDAESN